MGTANTGVMLVVQRIVGDLVDMDVGPYIRTRPFSQWVELDQPKPLTPPGRPERDLAPAHV